MKVLHTSDWHIGKRLYKYELLDDFNIFSSWLINTVISQKVDVLVVSGDIFDSFNPSQSSVSAYFNTLSSLYKTGVKIVLTAGNHDSALSVSSPGRLLENLDIHVVGQISDNPRDYVFPFSASESDKLCVVAIPFLRDSDLLSLSYDNCFEQSHKAIQRGIESTFRQASEFCRTHFSDHYLLAMGHLFACGVTGAEENCDAESEIQIGNQALFDANALSGLFNYIALGHIHRPQKVSSSTATYYSGSPYSLSFSERRDSKRVIILDTVTGEVQSLPTPTPRHLISIKGNLNHISQKLSTLESPSCPLPTLVEIELIEKHFSCDLEDSFKSLVYLFSLDNVHIVKEKMTFCDRLVSTSELFSTTSELFELSPTDVFEKFLSTYTLPDQEHDYLLNAFNLVLSEVQQEN